MENMKALKSFMCMLLTVVCSAFFYSCQNLSLEAAIEEMNKEMPTEVTEGMVGEGFTLGDNGIVCNITVDEELYDINEMKANAAEMKQGIIESLDESIHDDKDMKNFLKLAVDNNQPLNYKYEGNVSGETARVKISVNELKKILE